MKPLSLFATVLIVLTAVTPAAQAMSIAQSVWTVPLTFPQGETAPTTKSSNDGASVQTPAK